jgi:hypothetical protein
LVIITTFVFLGTVPSAYSVDVESTVTILQLTCGIEVTSGSPIGYGDLTEGETSERETLTLANTGNTIGIISGRGTHWTDDTAVKVMDVGATHFHTGTGVSYEDMPALSDSDSGVTSIGTGGQSTVDIFWQLRADLVSGQETFGGTAEQTVTLTSTC